MFYSIENKDFSDQNQIFTFHPKLFPLKITDKYSKNIFLIRQLVFVKTNLLQIRFLEAFPSNQKNKKKIVIFII